jgi:hypothetical protein
VCGACDCHLKRLCPPQLRLTLIRTHRRLPCRTPPVQVRELNDENEVELEFCTDVVVTFKSAFLARRNRYPPRGVVIEQLSQLLGKVRSRTVDVSSPLLDVPNPVRMHCCH